MITPTGDTLLTVAALRIQRWIALAGADPGIEGIRQQMKHLKELSAARFNPVVVCFNSNPEPLLQRISLRIQYNPRCPLIEWALLSVID